MSTETNEAIAMMDQQVADAMEQAKQYETEAKAWRHVFDRWRTHERYLEIKQENEGAGIYAASVILNDFIESLIETPFEAGPIPELDFENVDRIIADNEARRKHVLGYLEETMRDELTVFAVKGSEINLITGVCTSSKRVHFAGAWYSVEQAHDIGYSIIDHEGKTRQFEECAE